MSKYQARFEARRFSQAAGVDYNETYSPTAKLTTIRTVLACGASMGMDFYQIDVRTAYLNAPIEEEIYRDQPEGYSKGNELVSKLQRSISLWSEAIGKKLVRMTFGVSG